ncbi:MAG: VWA domain-containing protein, partial [Anaerolineaceae bacterium]|nr:VWA domain-containing protein [Anaerolineaceae bacterium]
MDVTIIPPSDLPATLPELARYDTIVLANVLASSLPSGAMEALPVYIRDLGKGLLMTGGDSAFGAGGYLRTPLETALPVYMDVKSRELAANLALIVAVDKSGSMGRCHCDNPDLNQTYTAVETGQPKVDIAKEAIMRSASALGNEDYLGVLTFDSQAHWALKPQLLPGQNALENAISSFQAEGQTNMFTGVDEAYKALQGINAKRKHIILLTDGWVRTGDLTQLANQMQEQGITLSIIAAGEGSAEYLRSLSEAGGGRYYPAVDMMRVPDIFLKETVKSVGQYIIEEPFYPLPASPSPIFRGIDENDLPGLLGYNGTSPKNTARLDLLTPRGDPLLASWQFGLGRAAAWTSDLKGRWATDWVKWNQFARFSAQLVDWLLPAPQIEGLDSRVTLSDAGAAIHVEAMDKEGHPLNALEITARLIDPQLKTIEVPLVQIGPGQYEVTSRVDQPGTYLVWLGVTNNREPMGQMTLGLVVPYSPEYRAGGVNIGFLDELSRVTGGGLLGEPVRAFLHNLPALDSAKEIWRALLLIVALLFPIDVALRRLVISRRDVEHTRSWIINLVSRQKTSTKEREAPVLGQLFAARERARQQTKRGQAREANASPEQEQESKFPDG